MSTSRNGFRTNHTGGDSQEPMYDPFHPHSSQGFYHDIQSPADSRTHPGPLDTVFDHDLGSVTGHTSSSRSSTISRNQGESFLTTKPSPVEGKTKRFPKFKFSLTAPPPKSKPKKPVESRPAVRVGGRGGAGNAKRFKTAPAVLPGDPTNPEKRDVSTPVEHPRASHRLPEGEMSNSEENGSPTVSSAAREFTLPRMETGRGGNGNYGLDESPTDRVVAHNDLLIQQYREMQAEQAASRSRRGGVDITKRPDDGTDREYCEYSTSPPSANPEPRDFGSRGRAAGILRNKGSWTTLSSGMSAVPDLGAYPNSGPHTPFPGETLGPVLEQEDAGVLAARGYDAHLVRVGSGRRANPGYASPPGAWTGNIRSGEPLGRTRSGSVPLPRLYIPSDAPLPPYQSGGEGRRPSALEGMVGSRAQDIAPDKDYDRHFYSHGSNMSSGKETPLSSQARDPQRPSRAPTLAPYQHGLDRRVPQQFGDSLDSPEDRPGYTRTPHYSYQTAHTSPTIVSPPTPSTVFGEDPPNFFFGGNKVVPKLQVANSNHVESDPLEKPDIGDRARELGPDEHLRTDLEMMRKSREEGRETPSYLDLFGGRGTASTETDSVNHRREGTPFSDRSSVLIPRRASSDALSSMAKKAAQNHRPTNPQLPRADADADADKGADKDIPLVVPTRPTSRLRSSRVFEEEESSLHCDELNIAPPRALSKMEKAILRRVEFGLNVDLTRIQLS